METSLESNAIATLATGFIYLGARIGYSLYTKNSAAFWKSREELLNAEVHRAANAINPEKEHKKKQEIVL